MELGIYKINNPKIFINYTGLLYIEPEGLIYKNQNSALFFKDCNRILSIDLNFLKYSPTDLNKLGIIDLQPLRKYLTHKNRAVRDFVKFNMN